MQDEVEYADVALLCLTRHNPLRAAAIRLVTWKYYESFTLALIIASCTTLAMDSTREVRPQRLCSRPGFVQAAGPHGV